MTIKEAKEIGLFELMPNGFTVFDSNDNDITERFSELEDMHIDCIGVDVDEFIPAIYIKEEDE